MRRVILTLCLLGGAVISQPAHADPYRWCAQYGGGRGGGENCYFRTFSQCRAAISGMGGFCRRNGFYDGRPVRTPEDRYERRR
jgi:hypothetical protein